MNFFDLIAVIVITVGVVVIIIHVLEKETK